MLFGVALFCVLCTVGLNFSSSVASFDGNVVRGPDANAAEASFVSGRTVALESVVPTDDQSESSFLGDSRKTFFPLTNAFIEDDWRVQSVPDNNSKKQFYADNNGDATNDYDAGAYSFTFSGRYALHRFFPENVSHSSSSAKSSAAVPLVDSTPYSEGRVFSVLLSRESAIQSVRLSSIQLQLEAGKVPEGSDRHIIRLSGLGLKDAATFMFRGTAFRPELYLPFQDEKRRTPSPVSSMFRGRQNLSDSFLRLSSQAQSLNTCTLLGSFRFETSADKSRSARPLNLQLPYTPDAEWGFDDSHFGSTGGSWNQRRLLSNANVTRKTLHSEVTPRGSFPGFASSTFSFRNLTRPLRALLPKFKGNQQADSSEHELLPDFEPEAFKVIPLSTVKHLLSGVIISPNCGIKLVISSSEVDLLSLATRVIHFSFFFVFKNLLEVSESFSRFSQR